VAEFTTERVPVGDTQLFVLKGGAGRPMVVLHGIEGHEGWLAFHAALAETATVYAPSHPGYGHTECPDWISAIQHQAVFYHWFLQQADLYPGGDPVDLVGSGIGGWIAAQMAIMCGVSLRHLVLIDPAGMRPEHGELLDIFVTPWQQVIDRGFYDAPHAAEYQRIYTAAPLTQFGGLREAGRTMTMRMCFRPYMYDPALPAMLGKVRVPTLIVWGEHDRLIPLECATVFQQSIPGAVLRVVDECGHFAHLEKPAEVAALVRQFVSQ
jgi:pimeloyl-ACP methyl ester carboxylesterase